jgi:ribonuclease HII
VVVCAASFDRIPESAWVRDSKQLSAWRRSATADWLRTVCRAWAVVEIWQETIDRVNIAEATRLAMRSAVTTVAVRGCRVVVDHVDLGDIGYPVRSTKRADSTYFSVAAASILAKVHRDQIMIDLSRDDDRWEWSRNKGYGTLSHRRAIGRFGRSYLHRRSFRISPVLP